MGKIRQTSRALTPGGGACREVSFPRIPSGAQRGRRGTGSTSGSLVAKRALMVLAYRRTRDCQWLQTKGFNDPLPQTFEDMGINIDKIIETSTSESDFVKSVISPGKKESDQKRMKSYISARQQAVTSEEIRSLEQQLKPPESKHLRPKQSMLYPQMHYGSHQQSKNNSQKQNTQNKHTKDTKQRIKRKPRNDQRKKSLSRDSNFVKNSKEKYGPEQASSISHNDLHLGRKQELQQREEEKRQCKTGQQYLKLSTGEVNLDDLSVEDFVARFRPSIIITRIEAESPTKLNKISIPKSTKNSVQEVSQFQRQIDKNKLDRRKETKPVCASKSKIKRLRLNSTQAQGCKLSGTTQQKIGRASNQKSVFSVRYKHTREEQLKRRKDSNSDKIHKQDLNQECVTGITGLLDQERVLGQKHDLIEGHTYKYKPVKKQYIASENNKESKEEFRVYPMIDLTEDHSSESSGNFEKESILNQEQDFVEKPVMDQVHLKQEASLNFKKDFEQKHLSHFNQEFTQALPLGSTRAQSQALMLGNELDLDQQEIVILENNIIQDHMAHWKRDLTIRFPSTSKHFFGQGHLPKRSQNSYQTVAPNHSVGSSQNHIADRKQDLIQIYTHKNEKLRGQKHKQNHKQGFINQEYRRNHKWNINQEHISVVEHNLNQEHRTDQKQDFEEYTVDCIPQVNPYRKEDALDQIPQLIPNCKGVSDHISQLIPDHKLKYNSENKSKCRESSRTKHTMYSNVTQKREQVTEFRKKDNFDKELIPIYHSSSSSNVNFSDKNAYGQTKVEASLMPWTSTSTLNLSVTETRQKSTVQKKRKRSKDRKEKTRKRKRKPSNTGVICDKPLNETISKLQSEAENESIAICQEYKAKDTVNEGGCVCLRCKNRGKVSSVKVQDVMIQQLHLENSNGQQYRTKTNSNTHRASSFATQLADQIVDGSPSISNTSNSTTYSRKRKRPSRKKRRRSSTDFAGLSVSSEAPSVKQSRQVYMKRCLPHYQKSSCNDKANYITNQHDGSNHRHSLLTNASANLRTESIDHEEELNNNISPPSPLPSSSQLNKLSTESKKFRREYDECNFPALLGSSDVKFRVPMKGSDNLNPVLEAANLVNIHSSQSATPINQCSGVTNLPNIQLIKSKDQLNNSTPLLHKICNNFTDDDHSGSVKRKNIGKKILNVSPRNNYTKLEKYQRKVEHQFEDLKQQLKDFRGLPITDKKTNSGIDKSNTDDVQFLGCKEQSSEPKKRKRSAEKNYGNKEQDKHNNKSQAISININSSTAKHAYRNLENKSRNIGKGTTNLKKETIIQSKQSTISEYLNQSFAPGIQRSSSRFQPRNVYSHFILPKDILDNSAYQLCNVDNQLFYQDDKFKSRYTQQSILDSQHSNTGILLNNELHAVDTQCAIPANQHSISASQPYITDEGPRMSNGQFNIPHTKTVTPGCQPVISKSLPAIHGCHPIVSCDQVTGPPIQHTNIARQSFLPECHSVTPNQSSIHEIPPSASNNALMTFVSQYSNPVITPASQHYTPVSHFIIPESHSIITSQFYIPQSHLIILDNHLFVPISQSSVTGTCPSDTNNQLSVFYGQSPIPTFEFISSINQSTINGSLLSVLCGHSGIPVSELITHINQANINDIQLYAPVHQSSVLGNSFFSVIQTTTSGGQLTLPNIHLNTPISQCGIFETQNTVPYNQLRFVDSGFSEASTQNLALCLRNQPIYVYNKFIISRILPVALASQRHILGSHFQLNNTSSLTEISDSPSSNLSELINQSNGLNARSINPNNDHNVHTTQFDDLIYRPFHFGDQVLNSCSRLDQYWECAEDQRHHFGHPDNHLHVSSSQSDETTDKPQDLSSQPMDPGIQCHCFRYQLRIPTDHPKSFYNQAHCSWSQFCQPSNQPLHRNNKPCGDNNWHYHSSHQYCASLNQSGSDDHQPSSSSSQHGRSHDDVQKMVRSKPDIPSDPSVNRNNQVIEISSTATSPSVIELVGDRELLLRLSAEPNPVNHTEDTTSTEVKTNDSTQ